ncbi:MAG TPA: CAP domain-containing protein [Candidatus Paceibacterota bacterium]
MRKTLKKYFIPHQNNDYKPHILRERSVFVLSIISILLFVVFTFNGFLISSIQNLASLLPSVLTDYANDTRTSLTLSPLKANQTLTEAAQMKANDMAAKSYFAHTSPEGISPWFWISKAGYNFTYAGENLAVNFSDSYDVHKAWLNSPGHRANIVNTNFTEIGIATAEGTYEGKRTTFVVQMFGRPAPTFDLVKPAVAAEEATLPVVKSEEKFDLIPIEPIIENDLFIAVRNPEAEVAEEVAPINTNIQGEQSYSSWFVKALSTPKRTLTFAYVILAAIILVALTLAVLIEVRRQHPKHIIYAIGLLLLIGVLLYLARDVVLPVVLIT